MNKSLQWLIAGALTAVIVLQVTIITQIPSLDEIDKRISHWTMHYGQHFSSDRKVSGLESKLQARLLEIEKKLDELSNDRQ